MTRTFDISGYTRYLLENMYGSYLPYMPATESLAMFAHNSAQLEATLQAQAVQHRIYDLQKGTNTCTSIKTLKATVRSSLFNIWSGTYTSPHAVIKKGVLSVCFIKSGTQFFF